MKCLRVAVTVCALFGCAHLVRAQPGPAEKGDEAGKKFRALKDRLPDILPTALREAGYLLTSGAAQERGVVELARRIGPAKAKVTLVIQRNTAGVGQEPTWAEAGTLLIFLDYFEGAWITTGWDGWANIPGIQPAGSDNAMKRIAHTIMRSIDKSSAP